MPLVQQYYSPGAPSNMIDSSYLNGLANNALYLHPFDLSFFWSNEGGLLFADFQLSVKFATAPAANSCVSMWVIQTLDGNNQEDGSPTITPARGPDAIFPVRAVTTLQQLIRRVVLPAGGYRILLKNDNTGAAFTSDFSSTLAARLFSTQSVTI